MMNNHWTAGLHHDGSALYVSNPLPKMGETLMVKLRVPAEAPITTVYLRTAPDGEGHMEAMHEEGQKGITKWWSAKIPIKMPYTPYRFRILSSEGGFWLTQLGVSRADGPDECDFKLLADFAAPSWIADSVFYQIFPDRFARSESSEGVPAGAWSRGQFTTQQREWGQPPLHYREGGTLDFFGGDLRGIAQKTNYLRDLGVNAIYLNPIFTAYTNHRYDVADYHHVDPHLGGDDALAELRQAFDRAGLRLILDVTPNHAGDRNVWFKAAQEDANAPTAEYFTFIDHPDHYESWLGHKTLVKLNYQSEKLRDAMYRAPDSVMRRWLHEPYRIDGWRMDVANMTARQGAAQLGHKVWREMRKAIKGDNPQAYLLGEDFFDGTPHLQGDELDATMNYKGFTIPLWSWLRSRDHLETHNPIREWLERNLAWYDPVRLSTEALAEQWKRFRAPLPWVTARQQFNQIDSHDTPRIRWITGNDGALVRLATVLLMTFPGVPCVYYGDEIGMDGGTDPDNRRTMIWDESGWNQDLRAFHQRLIHLRRTAPALVEGGFQMIYAAGDVLAYQRESGTQRLLVVAYRGSNALNETAIPVWQGGIADGTTLKDILSGRSWIVEHGAIRLSGLEYGAALVLEG